MSDHSELVAEIATVEKMNTPERLKHARKRRVQQLKRFAQYEKQLEKENKKKKGHNNQKKKTRKTSKVQFEGNIMLLEAAARGDIEEVRFLLQQTVSPDVTNEDGLTALHQCCIDDGEEMMKLLLDYGANVNARDSELWTPLHAAATCGHRHLCKYLIDKGAELLSVNADGNMPYDICEDEMTLDFIESEMAKRGVTQELIDGTRLSTEKNMINDLNWLADNNGDLEVRDRVGATPLHIAAANGYTEVVEFLLDHHVAVDARDDDSWQAIHAAACWGHPSIVELLVQNGADLDSKTKGGETPYDICEDPELKDRILEMKSEIETNRKLPPDFPHKRSQNPRSPQENGVSQVDSHMHVSTCNSTTSLYSSNTSLCQSDKNHFSASVRRTSMRDKTALSRKEAREEARIWDSTTSDEDMEFKKATLAVSQEQNESEEVPTSNIDDIQVNMSDTEDPPPAQQEDIVETIGEGIPSVPSMLVEESVKKDKVEVKEVDMERQDSKKNKKKRDNNKNDIEKDNESPIPIRRENLPHTQPICTVSDTDIRSSPSAEEKRHHDPVPGKPPKAVQSSPELANRGTIFSTPSKSETNPPLPFATPPSGTLADLKKQRALQNSLRFKDPGLINSQIAMYNSPTGQAQVVTNGTHIDTETKKHNGQQNSGRYRDTPMHKFTANQEIIGGGEEKKGCCVIL